MSKMISHSWGNNKRVFAEHRTHSQIANVVETVVNSEPSSVIPRGAGRSYGDQALVTDGLMISLTQQDHLENLEMPISGLINVKGGMSIGQLLDATIPLGWILPVIPGSQHITIGGALAADAHGKNHWHQSSIASCCEELNVMISDGSIIRCSRETENQLFWATIGGLGLTGLITSATLRLQRIAGTSVKVQTKCYENLSTLLKGFDDATASEEYAVAWLDLLTSSQLGRGIVKSASVYQHGQDWEKSKRFNQIHLPKPRNVNVVTPRICRTHNNLKYLFSSKAKDISVASIRNYLFPLDRIRNWNSLYGKSGLIQWQFILPDKETSLLEEIIMGFNKTSALPSLAVLKRCGEASESYLSFCSPGWTLAIDLPANQDSYRYISKYNPLIANATGRIYLAKDSCVDSGLLGKMYPRLAHWKAIQKEFDPKGIWQSDLSRRLKLCS
ncbi:MAG: hypothetical protein CL431_01175 [Acidimicrobiaceae bacterium]|nr:hypothetical protein [Acidimicrobiaceae bacterium]|tara:strand:- start:6123 stop:7454 length:1332 start_codon:yes stop_codon:yes gene_type:complete